MVASASPPTLPTHNVATATARYKRAARSAAVICVRCHGQPARFVHLQPCAIQARMPYRRRHGPRVPGLSRAARGPSSKAPSRSTRSKRVVEGGGLHVVVRSLSHSLLLSKFGSAPEAAVQRREALKLFVFAGTASCGH